MDNNLIELDVNLKTIVVIIIFVYSRKKQSDKNAEMLTRAVIKTEIHTELRN